MFDYTEKEKEKVLQGYFSSHDPLQLTIFPSKQKKQYIVLKIILEMAVTERVYSESEINDVFASIYPDFVTIRRAMIDYRLMKRDKYGKAYEVMRDHA